MKTIIIEDDPFHMEVISDLIRSDFPQLKIEGKATSSSEGIQIIKLVQPELVFLDIDLPDKSGFEMLKEIPDINFEIVFVTGHSEYAMEAHQFDTIGYLIKPITKEGISNALKKLSFKKRFDFQNAKFEQVIDSIRRSIDQPQKISVPSIKDIQYINIGDVTRMEADGNYTSIHLINNKTLTSSRQIGEYEDRLTMHNFYRIHDKHLVNLRFIQRFVKTDSGCVEMPDGTLLPVSRRKKEEFLKVLSRYFA